MSRYPMSCLRPTFLGLELRWWLILGRQEVGCESTVECNEFGNE